MRSGRRPFSLLSAMLLAVGCHSGDGPRSETDVPASHSGHVAVTTHDSSEAIERFCSDCHVAPRPSSFPRANWAHEVEKGYDFYYQSLRTDLDPPPLQATIDYYTGRAPEHLAQCIAPRPRVDGVAIEALDSPEIHAAAHVRWFDGDDQLAGLWVCDMAAGRLWHGKRGDAGHGLEWHSVAEIPNPARIERCDLDGTAEPQLVVADLGSFLPEDHLRGAVWWLRFDRLGQRWTCVPIQTGLARVSDVRPIDADGDGDQDLIVAEFGWRKTGQLTLLRNSGMRDDGQPGFSSQRIDDRHGAIHVPVTDLNGDGADDFIALIAQEHEAIVLFENSGDGEFTAKPLYQADDPAFGSSGITLVDMDGDGDQDILYTNGDSFDSALAKDYHGVRWLENCQNGDFAVHEIGPLPGVHWAQAADFDGDGDLDVIACALLPDPVLADPERRFDGIVLFEQQADGVFACRSIVRDDCHFASGDVVDLNVDGRPDFVTVGFRWERESSNRAVWLRNDGLSHAQRP